MNKQRISWTALLVGLALACPSAWAKTIHVSTGGNDAWTGQIDRPNSDRSDGPVATLARARDIIRQWKSAAPLDEPVRVIVADGVYPLAEPFVLAPQDSGTQACPISYERAPGASPVISGGRAISGFQPAADGLWQAEIPDVAAGKWYFEQLIVDGARAVRAKSPNELYDNMGQTVEVPIAGQSGQFRRTTEIPASALAPLEGLSAEELHDVTLVAFHKWCITRRFVSEIDRQANTLITVGGQLKSYSDWPANTRFHLENFKAALDTPGEWFLSRQGTLYYMPLAGQDMTKAQVIAPVAEKLMVIQGKPEQGQFVEHVALQGLSFQHNSYRLPPQGYEPYQAAFATEAAVMADGARNVALVDCEIQHTGDYAAWFRRGCHNCEVRNCYLSDLGAGGVRIGEGEIRQNLDERTHHITVDNSIIQHGGRIHTEAVGVWIGQSGDNTVTHNDIADLYYTGISAGWRWGYSDGLAKNNSIRFNHVHDLGHGVLSDMGGIYTLGPSEGTVIGNNVFHDIYSADYGGWGLYTDEGSTGITLENNLVYNTKTGSFHQHYGKDNIVRNNMLVCSENPQIAATRVEDHLSFTLDHNIVYWKTGTLFGGPWDRIRANVDYNCYFNAAGEPFNFAGMDLAAWRKLGRDEHSIIADPLFVDPENHDYHLRPESPALKIGFKPFEYKEAGVYGDAKWIEKATLAKTVVSHVSHPFACCDYTSGKVLIVSKEGKVEWEYPAPSCDDLWVLPNGNLLFVTGHGVKEVTRDRQVVFTYESKSEIYGCQRLANGNTFIAECNAGRLLEVDPSGKIVKQINLLPEGQDGGHVFMRNARQLENGNYLVAHSGQGVVREYDGQGAVVAEFSAPGGPHSVVRLPNGNTLIASGDRNNQASVVELDAQGKTVWQITNEDLPGIELAFMSGLQRLPNGNTVMTNWLGHGHLGTAPHVIEVTPKKEVVWTFADHAAMQTISTIQLLDVPGDATQGEILH